MRSSLLVPALVAAAVALAAGAAVGRASTTAAPVTITADVSEAGYVMPSRIAGGVVAMRFRNTGRRVHEFALGRIDPGHTVQEARQAFAANRRTPWLRDVAGPGVMTPGAEITITRRLAPGTYLFLDPVPDTLGVPFARRHGWKALRVEGDSGADLPRADAVVVAEETRLRVPQLRAGTRTIELRNASGSGRGFMLATVNPGRTRADAERWFTRIETTGRQPATTPPATLLGAIQSIPSGTSVYLTLRLQAGRLYEISDDESGIRATFTPR